MADYPILTLARGIEYRPMNKKIEGYRIYPDDSSGWPRSGSTSSRLELDSLAGRPAMDDPMLTSARALAGRLTALRRDLHMHPELSFQETRTAAVAAQAMAALGARVRPGWDAPGWWPTWARGRTQSALRADMDALPLQEENAVGVRIPGARGDARLRPRRPCHLPGGRAPPCWPPRRFRWGSAASSSPAKNGRMTKA